MQLKKRPVLKQKTEVLKFYQKTENEYKKPMILLSVLAAENKYLIESKTEVDISRNNRIKSYTPDNYQIVLIDLSDLKET